MITLLILSVITVEQIPQAPSLGGTLTVVYVPCISCVVVSAGVSAGGS